MNQHTVYSEVSNLVGNIETLLQSYLEKMDGKLKNEEVREIQTFLHDIDSRTRNGFEHSSQIYETPLSEVTLDKPTSCC